MITDPPLRTSTAFERATAVEPRGDRYVGQIDLAWAAPTGPNGGYLAAMIVRALSAAIDPDGERQLRSLSLQYLRSAEEGPIELDVRPSRAGRRLASGTVTARQNGRDLISGFASFATRGLASAGSWSPLMPEVAPAPPADAPGVPADRYRRDADAWLEVPEGLPPVVHQLRLAPRLGGTPFGGRVLEPGEVAESGGWMRSPEVQRIDAAYVAQLTDFWWPPALEIITVPAIVPTIDLTIHFRADLPPAGLEPQAVLGHYRSAAAGSGLVEEDGSLFLADGTLLAQSRQLALLAPLG